MQLLLTKEKKKRCRNHLIHQAGYTQTGVVKQSCACVSKVARILEVTPEVQRMMGVHSGMELLTLPHGQQLRLDLLER